MKAASNCLFLLALVATPSIATAAASADAVADIYRAPSLDGFTGLLTMNLPYSAGKGMTVAGGGSYADAYTGVYESLTTVVGALRIGFSDNVEVAVKTKTHSLKPVTGNTESGMGDTEFGIKWKFREQNENLPAMALALGVITPTGDEDKGFTEAENWGGKFGVTAGAEIPVFRDGYLGLYAEVQAVAIDKLGDDTAYTDMYSVTNFGIAFPISDDNHLSFFVEYHSVAKKDVPGIEQNHTAISPGLRFAHRNFSLSFAAQSVTYDDDTSQDRILGLLSLGF